MKRIIMAYREVRNKRGQVERIAVKSGVVRRRVCPPGRVEHGGGKLRFELVNLQGAVAGRSRFPLYFRGTMGTGTTNRRTKARGGACRSRLLPPLANGEMQEGKRCDGDRFPHALPLTGGAGT